MSSKLLPKVARFLTLFFLITMILIETVPITNTSLNKKAKITYIKLVVYLKTFILICVKYEKNKNKNELNIKSQATGFSCWVLIAFMMPIFALIPFKRRSSASSWSFIS